MLKIKEPVSQADMQKLMEIAENYKEVKNYVFHRYGGIASLSKIYPGCTVQNEITKSGLRAELAMQSLYFYRAIFDELGENKSQFVRTKSRLFKLIDASPIQREKGDNAGTASSVFVAVRLYSIAYCKSISEWFQRTAV